MIYNFKSDKQTQEHVFDNSHELLQDILSTVDTLRNYEFISIYTNANTIARLLEWISILEYGDVGKLIVETIEHDENKQMILTISYDQTIGVEEMYQNNKCKFSESTLTYVHDTVCKSDVITTHENHEENILCFCLKKELEDEVVN